MKKKGLTEFECFKMSIINDLQPSPRCPLFFNFFRIYRDFSRKGRKKKKGKRESKLSGCASESFGGLIIYR
jgi:hypothetical protein